MDSHTTMLVIWIYGALVLVGGIIGFVKAKSKASLVAGGVSGAVLLACGVAVQREIIAGLWTAAGLTILLLLFFAARFAKTKAMMPAGMMAVVSFVALVLIIFGFKGKL